MITGGGRRGYRLIGGADHGLESCGDTWPGCSLVQSG